MRKVLDFIACGSLLILSASLTPANAAIVSPTLLTSGSTVSPLPNGGSSGDGIPETKLFDKTESFSFLDGLLAGTLRERVIRYSDAPSVLHPGLYFDYEIHLTAGSVAAFGINGYSGYQASVKECGISICGGSGANGVLATSASRSSNGNLITFDFANTLLAGQHSANLQIFSSSALYQDPLAFFTSGDGGIFSIDAVAPAPAVPEPSTWAMMLLGFCSLGLIAYRRKSAALSLIAA
ncbi:PEPxxWA-CTERM sorting domain-containing protein [Bradyrhizobium sp. INPA01-394B]|uniref:PEPxxWA-CTERM sorting domain-containing protein n=1 Tax=Bradyrhizobium campsiandrae TaxID=1729892 RepID=A0ABR7UHM5_9BRAD|nr:PEPxxWA-CTERM sorting domain-containing protein [Bradyrhizobium campsiandrae]MBC9878977.1 PEPxxWA-CTERM sorting domain-containing protein [Bradyrhizobium campsiandrae]MBC9982917.1 PEPxxWA-CTERM sorting domain-containing protein [Bradyrhizobium campsiandrae]